MKKFFLFIVFGFLACGIFSCQPQAEKAQQWIDTPIATTQPGQPPTPTHGQVIQIAADTGAAVSGPWGVIISGVVTGSLLLLQTLAANKKRNDQLTKLDTAVAVVTDVQQTLDAVAANTPLHPSSVVTTKSTVK